MNMLLQSHEIPLFSQWNPNPHGFSHHGSQVNPIEITSFGLVESLLFGQWPMAKDGPGTCAGTGDDSRGALGAKSWEVHHWNAVISRGFNQENHWKTMGKCDLNLEKKNGEFYGIYLWNMGNSMGFHQENGDFHGIWARQASDLIGVKQEDWWLKGDLMGFDQEGWDMMSMQPRKSIWVGLSVAWGCSWVESTVVAHLLTWRNWLPGLMLGRRVDVVTPGRGTGGQHKTIAGFGFMVNGAGIKTLVDRC